MKMRKPEILVVCDGATNLKEHMLQIVSKARSLADISEYQVSVLYCGQCVQEVETQIREHGADILFKVESHLGKQLWEYVDILTDVIRERVPKVILFQATDYGKNLAAIISARFETGLTADCIDITYDKAEGFAFVRAAICDSIIAQIKCINCDIHMGTVKENVFGVCKAEKLRDMAIENCDSSQKYYKDEIKCIQVEEVKVKLNEINLNQYSIHFCIGRGASSPQCVQAIKELAEKYNACVTCTRPIVEEGILERARQVGQSGKSVVPQIYVGFGVSGASQHIVGIRNAKKIIAINIDAKAPIFDYADYAIVANVEDIVTELNKAV